jgi:GMP synthase (glutamine-hydrolysing)
MDSIAILDFGSQYSQLIARRVREAHIYCQLFPHNAPAEQVMALDPCGFILSGGPSSVYDANAPQLPAYVLASGRPVLGICYGMHLLAQALGGHVAASPEREYGRALVQPLPLAPNGSQPTTSSVQTLTSDFRLPTSAFHAWMSHGDKVDRLPPGFAATATSDNCAYAAMSDPARKLFAIQFHPEVNHTEHGRDILRAFLSTTGSRADWTPGSMVADAVARVRAQVGAAPGGGAPVVAAVSGGVDSSVAAALVQRALGDQLTCVFVDTGLLRAGEPEAVAVAFRETLGARLVAVNAAEEFLDALSGVTDPEQKRKIIGEKFIRIFEREALRAAGSGGAGLGGVAAHFLVQGTIYPDVVESAGPERQVAAKIKTHHNVGGLPADLGFELVEPLRFLFKDEVRAVGVELGLPESMVWRQPFPGPGLAVRCLGELTWPRLETLRAADKIVTDELGAAGLLRNGTAQAFAVLLPVRSVGVMGDYRTYQETCAIRAVTTDDFMTADWARLPYDLLARISNRIVNEVKGINRVVYDISSKPPATIEWE